MSALRKLRGDDLVDHSGNHLRSPGDPDWVRLPVDRVLAAAGECPPASEGLRVLAAASGRSVDKAAPGEGWTFLVTVAGIVVGSFVVSAGSIWLFGWLLDLL